MVTDKPDTSAPKGPETLVSRDIVFPGDANHHGSLYAGRIFEMMIKQAFLTGTYFARVPLVAASCEDLDFLAPVTAGSLLECTGRVLAVEKNRMVVAVRLEAEHPLQGVRLLAARCQFIMAAIATEGIPKAIPLPKPEGVSPEESEQALRMLRNQRTRRGKPAKPSSVPSPDR